MSGEYGGDFITLINDDGEEFELEYLDSIEHEGGNYVAMLPTDIDENDENFGFVILKAIEENGEEVFVTVDDEGELDRVYEKFITTLFADEDEDGEDSDEESDEDGEQ